MQSINSIILRFICVGKPFRFKGVDFEFTLSSELGDFGAFLTGLVLDCGMSPGVLYLLRC